MKCIYPDVIEDAVATEQAAGYPDDYVLNDHPKLPWKATSIDATLTLTVGGAANALGIAGTNAETVVMTVKNAAGTETLWGPATYDLTGITDWYEFFTQTGLYQHQLWVDYDEQDGAHTVVLEMTGTDNPLYLGKAAAGLATVIPDPLLELSEFLVDHSVKDELASGASYYDLGDIVTGFRGQVRGDRASQIWRMMRRLAKEIGETPVFWKITDAAHPMWALYGRLDGMPTAAHSWAAKAAWSFSILEVL